MSYKKFTKKPQTDVSFLKKFGLSPSHKILDIGCGGGRLGWELISYLDRNNYYGFDKQRDWIQQYRTAVGQNNLHIKKPTILCTNFNFKFDESIKFDYVYAYSVFTHVGPDLVKGCLNNLKKHLTTESCFYTTIIQGTEKEKFEYNRLHPERPHEFLQARYDLKYFEKIANECGYKLEIIPEYHRMGPGHDEDASTHGNYGGHRMILLKRDS